MEVASEVERDIAIGAALRHQVAAAGDAAAVAEELEEAWRAVVAAGAALDMQAGDEAEAEPGPGLEPTGHTGARRARRVRIAQVAGEVVVFLTPAEHALGAGAVAEHPLAVDGSFEGAAFLLWTEALLRVGALLLETAPGHEALAPPVEVKSETLPRRQAERSLEVRPECLAHIAVVLLRQADLAPQISEGVAPPVVEALGT